MKRERVVSSIDTIEKTLHNYTAYKISEVDKILEEEVFKIRKETENIFIIEKIFDITFHWKVFSGQKTRDGHKSNQQKNMNHIISDCEKIKEFLDNYSE